VTGSKWDFLAPLAVLAFKLTATAIIIALLVTGVLWLIGLPGRRREARLAAEWRARHPQAQIPPRHAKRADR
jgi:hypothetical protein